MNILLLTGDYKIRQQGANVNKADLYLELHLNSANPDATGIETWVGSNASATSKRVAANIGSYLSTRTGLTLRHGGKPQIGGRAEGSVVYTDMPAALLEIGFASNQRDLQRIRGRIDDVADAILDAIEFSMPSGIRTLALSVGHVGKTTATSDRGAALADGTGYEADIALQIAAALINMTANPRGRINQ